MHHELMALRDWLTECGCTLVAMESEPALHGTIDEHHRFILRLQIGRIKAAEADLAVPETRIEEKLVPYDEPLRRLLEIPGVDRVVSASPFLRAIPWCSESSVFKPSLTAVQSPRACHEEELISPAVRFRADMAGWPPAQAAPDEEPGS